MQENNIISGWSEQLAANHLPRWSELPDIDLYMDQVISQLDKYLAPLDPTEGQHTITASMINNYVKLQLLPAPVKKRYSRMHLAHLVMICLLKQVVSIPEIKALLDTELAGCGEAGLPEIYNAFCAAQESAYADTARRAAAQPEDGNLAGAGLAVEMAVLAAASKALAQRLIAAAAPAPEESGKKKQPKV